MEAREGTGEGERTRERPVEPTGVGEAVEEEVGGGEEAVVGVALSRGEEVVGGGEGQGEDGRPTEGAAHEEEVEEAQGGGGGE